MIRRLLKIFAWSIGGLAFSLAIAFIVYDIAVFQSRSSQIDALISRAAPSERHPSDALRRLLFTDIHQPSAATARILIHELEVPHKVGGLGWQSTWALWSLLVKIHLTDDERAAILASQSIVKPETRGFAAGAKFIFGKPLESLDEKELATLVVLARWPRRFAQPEFRDRLGELRDELIERARDAR